MTDMPHWRAWADAAHKDSLRSKRVEKKDLFSCSKDRRHRLTKNQAKSSGGDCTHCGAPLKAKAHFSAERGE